MARNIHTIDYLVSAGEAKIRVRLNDAERKRLEMRFNAIKWFNLSTEYIEAREGRGRLETFSDGVFAIAMTLLVLNLNIQELAHGRSR